MTIGGQLRVWFGKNVTNSNPKKYLERLVQEVIDEINVMMSKEFAEYGLGYSRFDFVSAYLYVKEKIYKRYRQKCDVDDFCTIFNQKIVGIKELKMEKVLEIKRGEHFYNTDKFRTNAPTIYWCGTKEPDVKWGKRYLRRFFTKYIRNELLARIRSTQQERIILDNETFSVCVPLEYDDSILALKKFVDISDETIIRVLENVAKREELLFEVKEHEPGEKRIYFSIHFGGTKK